MEEENTMNWRGQTTNQVQAVIPGTCQYLNLEQIKTYIEQQNEREGRDRRRKGRHRSSNQKFKEHFLYTAILEEVGSTS